MSMLSFSRFLLVLRNDLLAQGKRLLLGSGAALVAGILVYASNLTENEATSETPLYLVSFMLVLLLGGGLFTSQLYADLHHPQERYFALTLPVSAAERFLSRWLLGAPLFWLLAVLFMHVLQFCATLIMEPLTGLRPQPFALTVPVMFASLAFFLGQALMMLGALWFRSMQFAKTILAGLLLWLAYTVLAVLVTKLVFFDHFESIWSLESTVRFSIHFPDLLTSETFTKAMAFLLYLWLLFLSYSCLRDHEV
jgi:hypothetical protein